MLSGFGFLGGGGTGRGAGLFIECSELGKLGIFVFIASCIPRDFNIKKLLAFLVKPFVLRKLNRGNKDGFYFGISGFEAGYCVEDFFICNSGNVRTYKFRYPKRIDVIIELV